MFDLGLCCLFGYLMVDYMCIELGIDVFIMVIVARGGRVDGVIGYVDRGS